MEGESSIIFSPRKIIRECFNDESLSDMDKVNKILSILGEYGPSEIDYLTREIFTENFAWAVPSMSILKEIVEFSDGKKVLEVGCGSGLWAGLLRLMGVNIVATDGFISHGFSEETAFVDIEKLSATEAALVHHDAEVLLIIWPNYDDTFATNVVKTFQGDSLIYIGETEGGCTADASFFRELKNNWTYNSWRYICIPQFYGLHDLAFTVKRLPTGDTLKFLCCVKSGDLEGMDEVFFDSIDRVIQDSDGRTAVHFGVENGVEVTKWLLERGFVYDIPDFDGNTPISDAITENKYDVARLLIDEGADVERVYDCTGDSLLHLVAKGDDSDMSASLVEKLVKMGLDPNITNNYSRTPLHEAVESYNHLIYDLLLKLGGSLDVEDDDGLTPKCLPQYNAFTEE